MRAVPLLFFFVLALTAALFGSILFPFFPLKAFAPFLAIAFYRAPFIKALWISCGSGLLLDLFSSEFRFGVQALTLALTTALLFHQKRHFFEEKPIAFSLLTAAISSVATLLQLLFIPLFDRGISFSPLSFLTDVIVLPLVDGLFGFLWFTCPMRLYIYIKKKGWKAAYEKSPAESHERSPKKS
jgi:rod shape-determining protein MreD